MMERIEKMRVSDDALDLVFRKARTYNAWLPKPVPTAPELEDWKEDRRTVRSRIRPGPIDDSDGGEG